MRDAFSLDPGTVAWFAVDWLGRQLGVMAADDVTPAVVVADVGLGSVKPLADLPTFVAATESGEISGPLGAANLGRFLEAQGIEGLGFSQCAAFVHPPFLGGDSSNTNLELSDIDVYWTVTGQLLAAVADGQED